MPLKDWFVKPPRYSAAGLEKSEARVPDGLMTKCPGCEDVLYNKELDKNLKVCPKCNFHFRLTAAERLAATVDEGTFEEYKDDLVSIDTLEFPEYAAKLDKSRRKTGREDAAVTGSASIAGYRTIIAVTDFSFMGGSMGSVVGEKITMAMERAVEENLPLLAISGSGGGARMQEGILSLMQMAKTSAAAGRMRKARIPYIVLLTDPTMGGVAASFASLGDITLAEPGALIGFAGPRVIEQTIRQKLPAGFQRAEFQMEHGFVDKVVSRREVVPTLTMIYSFFLD